MIKTEKQLLKFIKYSPLVLIIIFSIVINLVIFMQNEHNYKKDLESYKENFINVNKSIIKSQVDKVYNDIAYEKQRTEEELKINLKTKLLEAYSIVENLYEKNIHLGEQRVIELIREALRDIRFNENRGYYFLFDMNSTCILHPIRPEMENKKQIDLQDKKGTYIIKEMTESHKKNQENYSILYWVKPDDLEKHYKKINFTKIFEPLNLIIGTGEYIDDFTKSLQKHMIEDHIQKSIYGKNGYVFLVNYEGDYLAHIKQEYIGLNRIGLRDENGFEITKEIIKTAKQGQGYISYVGTIMPETGLPAKKTSYVRGFKDWNWAIASGYYEKEMLEYLHKKEEELQVVQKEYLTKTIFISIVVTIVLLIIVMFIAKYLEKSFKSYNDKILAEVNKNRRKDILLYQQSKMASMGEMIGNIAHQWRQPLNLISTATSRIQVEKDFGTLDEKSHDESLKAILNSTKYLSQTIDDFREFFNPNKKISHFDTVSLFNKAKQLISSIYKNKSISIIENVENVNLATYENELIQSLINILNNSIDALEEKDQEEKYIFFETKYFSSCEETNCNIMDCSQRKNAAFTSITIRDNAGGIPEDTIHKIFEAYFTTKHQSRGTGIGLYMTYEIITKHLDGFINVSNASYTYKDKEYYGAEFKICLPANTNFQT